MKALFEQVTALTAQAQAEQAVLRKHRTEAELNHVRKIMMEVAAQGHFYILVNKLLLGPDAIKQLREAGFIVTEYVNRNEYGIRWSNKGHDVYVYDHLSLEEAGKHFHART